MAKVEEGKMMIRYDIHDSMAWVEEGRLGCGHWQRWAVRY